MKTVARFNPHKETLVNKKFWRNAFKYLLGFALLTYVIWQNWSPPEGKGEGLADALQKPIQVGPLVLAAVLGLTSVLITFVRWYILVRAQDLPFRLSNAVRLGSVGFFFNTFLPGSVGGDIIKAAFIAREQDRRTVAVATVLIDRAVGLWGLVWLVALLGTAFWLGGNEALHSKVQLQSIFFSSLGIIALTVLLWAALGLLPSRRAERLAGRLERIPRVGPSAAEFWRAVWMYRRRGRSVAAALLLAMVGHVGFVLLFYFSAQIFRDPAQGSPMPTLAENFLIVPIGMAIQAVFPSPGGVGGGEYAFGRLYELVVPRSEPVGVMGALAQRVINWGIGLVGYLVYLRMRPGLVKAVEETPAEPVAAS